MIKEWIAALFLVTGALVLLFAAIGILRFPDLYARMHASSKSTSFGVALMVIGTAVHFMAFSTALEALLIVLFLFMTIPISAHLLARAGYFLNVPMYEETTVDELKGQYDYERKVLHSKQVPQGDRSLDRRRS
jgi:multicomponent Na+:H+ antiporter subunit G